MYRLNLFLTPRKHYYHSGYHMFQKDVLLISLDTYTTASPNCTQRKIHYIMRDTDVVQCLFVTLLDNELFFFL